MIRVVGGTYKRRQLKQPSLDVTRSTKDVAKEGLFNSLGDIKGKSFLDLFSGSGSIGIEAYSRGAFPVYLNDKNREPIKIINENLYSLGIKDIKVSNLDYLNALNFYKINGVKFDIVFLDPPYKMIINEEFIEKLISFDVMAPLATLILETDYALSQEITSKYKVKVLKYGRSLMNIIYL